MQGSMDDAAGRVWTVLARSERPMAFCDIWDSSHLGMVECVRGLQFWIDNDEIKQEISSDEYKTQLFSIKDRHVDDIKTSGTNRKTQKRIRTITAKAGKDGRRSGVSGRALGNRSARTSHTDSRKAVQGTRRNPKRSAKGKR